MSLLHTLLNLGAAAGIDASPLPQDSTADQSFIQAGLDIIFTILGAVAVMMMVIGGIKYAGSQGDPSGVSKAKATMIYAVIGLIIAILAVVIVDFVFGRITSTK